MATLTLRLRRPDGVTKLPVDLTVKIGTTDGTALDQTTHAVLGGPQTVKAGTETIDLVDLTGEGILPEGAVYWITAFWASDLEGRVWFWDGHTDAYLDELTTVPSELLPGPLVVEPATYDDTGLRQDLALAAQSALEAAQQYTDEHVPAASTSAPGLARRATLDETTTGADDNSFTTPAGVKAVTDAAKAAKVSKAGDTMTGLLTLSGDPTNVLHAATRQWVLARIADLTAGSPAELDTFLEAFQHWQTTESEIGTLTALIAGKQASDSDLDAIAGLATQPLGRSLLTAIDHAALVTLLALTKGDLGLGNVANLSPAGLAADPALVAMADASSNRKTKRVTMALSSPTALAAAGATAGWIERYPIRLPVTTTRWRLKVANRDPKNNGQGTAPIKLNSAHYGPLARVQGTRWGGSFSAVQQAVYALNGNIPTDATDLVTDWVTDPAMQFGSDPNAVQVAYTLAAGVVGTFASVQSTHCVRRIDGLGTLTTASGAGYVASPGILDLRLEYEFSGDNPIGLYVGASNDEGYLVGDYVHDAIWPWEAWPGAFGLRAGIPWVNAAIAGAKEASFTTPQRWSFSRFDLTTTVPDFAVVNLAGNSILGNDTSANIIANVAWTINNALRPMGIKKIYLCTMQPAGFASGSAQETVRQEFNAWVRQVPINVDGVIDFDLVMRDPVNVRNVAPEFVLADLLHWRRSGHQYVADAIGIGRLT